MKRRIYLVIALVVSLLTMFSSIALSKETQILKPVSESGSLQIVNRVPFAKNDKVDSFFKQLYIGAQVLEGGEFSPIKIITDDLYLDSLRRCTVICPQTGALGYMSGNLCIDCAAP